MVGRCHSGRLNWKTRQQFRDQFRMVHHTHAEFRVRRDLPIVHVEHRGAVRAARHDFLYFRVGKRLDELLRKLQKEIFVSGAPCGLTAAGFTRQHSPGNAGGIKDLFHREGYRLAVWIKTQSTSEPEQPFLLSVENWELIRFDQFLPRVLSNAPGIVRSAFHGRKHLDHFVVRNAALAHQPPAQVENFSSYMLDADGAHVLTRATGQALEEIFLGNKHFLFCFFLGSSRNDLSAGQSAFLQVQDDLFGIESFPRKVRGTKLGAAATLDTGIYVENVLRVKILEVNHAQVFAFFAQRAHGAGRLRPQEYRDGRKQQMQML